MAKKQENKNKNKIHYLPKISWEKLSAENFGGKISDKSFQSRQNKIRQEKISAEQKGVFLIKLRSVVKQNIGRKSCSRKKSQRKFFFGK